MKRNYVAALFLFAALLPGLSSCDDEENAGKSEEEVNAEKLAGSWTFGSNGYISLDAVDLTEEFEGFLIRFTKNHSYIVLNDPDNVFFPTGSWKFVEGNFQEIVLNKNPAPISIQYENSTTLLLSFTVTGNTPIGQRVSGISGNYTLRLTKE